MKTWFGLTGAVSAALIAFALPSSAAPERTVQFASAPGPLDNPLKGWCTYTFPGQLHQPYSLAYKYVSWKDLEPTEGNYQFAKWEKDTWNDPLCAGKHIVLRVYLDYPGNPTGVPDWLFAKGLKTHAYSDYGGGNSPDYDNPDLVNGLVKLIAALGKRYDHNPRVGFIEMGVLGYWGEWHTYPHTSWFASEATQERVVDAYHQAFHEKILMGRYAAGYLGKQDWLGYFDDMFPDDTNRALDWNFLPQMRAAGRDQNWRHSVIGGEMDPGHAKNWLGDGFARTMDAITAGHFTWIGPYNPGMEADNDPQYIARSAQMVRTMGYQYSLEQMTYTPRVKEGGSLSADIDGDNQGVAPFYYPWTVELALLSSDGTVAQTMSLSDDIRTWQPGAFKIAGRKKITVGAGSYSLAIGIVDPMTNAPDIKFANSLTYSNGWTILGKVKVSR